MPSLTKEGPYDRKAGSTQMSGSGTFVLEHICADFSADFSAAVPRADTTALPGPRLNLSLHCRLSV